MTRVLFTCVPVVSCRSPGCLVRLSSRFLRMFERRLSLKTVGGAAVVGNPSGVRKARVEDQVLRVCRIATLLNRRTLKVEVN